MENLNQLREGASSTAFTGKVLWSVEIAKGALRRKTSFGTGFTKTKVTRYLMESEITSAELESIKPKTTTDPIQIAPRYFMSLKEDSLDRREPPLRESTTRQIQRCLVLKWDNWPRDLGHEPSTRPAPQQST
ncbi:hypothetical protein NQ318_004088 [Aromia moschata]|uniref:Uncharacterized protein n=1 Tax=Aromia moschata TaxID=1265417 RepID=A0AAV8X4X0_9CUCU|nr:hypothetical protein NQ318_004088 [Aromia moschata]